MNEQYETIGKITIAPDVLLTIVKFTALQEPGVARLAARRSVYSNKPLRAKQSRQNGVTVTVHNGRVRVEVHVVADGSVSARELGENLQRHITNALKEMVGMPVEAVHVIIDDVESDYRVRPS